MRVTAYQALARGAIEKARYFLAQAEYAERDPNISSARLPYLANLEAAIVSARSTLDHLKSEFASKPGYRQWHDGEWRQLETNSVFNFISERRTWIVHRAAEKVNLTITMHAEMGAYATVTVNATVIRGKPWYKRSLKILLEDWRANRLRRLTVRQPARIPAPTLPIRPNVEDGQIFYFEDAQWRSKPALAFVGEYIDMVEKVVIGAEQKFP
jgi:hypothetical protein